MASASKTNGKEIAVPENTLPVLAQGQEVVSELAEVLADNIGDEASVFDLPRLTVPSGGNTTWKVPTDEGDLKADALQCVIVAKQKVRAYYKEAYEDSGGGPPDCFSPDGKCGFGDPGGACTSCPLAQFGSAKKGPGQACSEKLNLLLLTEFGQLPYLLSVPPTSLKPMKRYLFALSGKARAYHRCLHVATLVETRNKAGVGYAEIQWKFVRDLTPDEVEIAHAFRNSLSGLLGTVAATVDNDFSDDDTEGGE